MNFAVKKYFSTLLFFVKELNFHLVGVLILSLLVGVLDGLGLSVFLPLIKSAGKPESLNDESVFKIHSLFENLGIQITFTKILLFMLVIFFSKGAIKFFSGAYQVFIFQNFTKNLRFKILLLLNSINYEYFTRTDTGYIQNTITQEIDRISKATSNYIKALESIVLVSTYLALSFASNATFSFLVVIGSLGTNFIYRFINKKTRAASSVLVDRNSAFQSLILQYTNNYKYLRATGKINIFSTIVRSEILNVEKVKRRIGLLGAFSLSVREPLLSLVLVIVMFIHVSILNGSIETLVFVLILFYRGLQSVLSFQTRYNNFLAMQGSVENVRKFLKTGSDNKQLDGDISFSSLKDSIVLDDVCVNIGDSRILSNVSLTIKRNETVALIGASGSGKSTLLNVLAGLIPIDKGNLTVDSVNFNKLNLETYQNRIGYISQEPVVFTDTIFNNVTMYQEKSQSTFPKFEHAIDQASLTLFMSGTKLKEDTFLASNGVNLSGGEKQRLCIARELYKGSELLLMDEATSALDSDTEERINRIMLELKGKKTMVLAAHRMTSIQHADKIVLMENGKIKAVGTYEDMMKKHHV